MDAVCRHLCLARRQLPLRAPEQAQSALRGRKEGTAIGLAQQSDSERTLLFNLRSAFVGVLQAKAVLRLAKDNLDSYDKMLKVSRDRFQAGDIAQIDLDRLELQRVQYESDLQTALVNLRTTKINLLALLDDRRPVDSSTSTGLTISVKNFCRSTNIAKMRWTRVPTCAPRCCR